MKIELRDVSVQFGEDKAPAQGKFIGDTPGARKALRRRCTELVKQKGKMDEGVRRAMMIAMLVPDKVFLDKVE